MEIHVPQRRKSREPICWSLTALAAGFFFFELELLALRAPYFIIAQKICSEHIGKDAPSLSQEMGCPVRRDIQEGLP